MPSFLPIMYQRYCPTMMIISKKKVYTKNSFMPSPFLLPPSSTLLCCSSRRHDFLVTFPPDLFLNEWNCTRGAVAARRRILQWAKVHSYECVWKNVNQWDSRLMRKKGLFSIGKSWGWLSRLHFCFVHSYKFDLWASSRSELFVVSVDALP